MEKADCALADREDRIVGYLAGTLSAADAEAFEAHYFACDLCWRELQQGLDVRAAAAPEHAAHLSAPRRVNWRWVAVAATVVMAAALWRWGQTPPPVPVPSDLPATSSPPVVQPTPPTPPVTTTPPARGAVPSPPRGNEPVLRSPSVTGLRPSATRDASGDLRVEWSAVESASRYVLTIIASDATTVLSRPTTATSLRLDAAALAGRLAGEQLFGQIEAFNALGVALGKSPRFDIPVRREEVQR